MADCLEDVPVAEVSQAAINLGVIDTVAVVAGATLLGLATDAYLSRRHRADREEERIRTRRWSIMMLVSSYALLIPGLALTLVSFSISVTLFGITQTLVSEQDTTAGVIETLWERNAVLGGMMVGFYAFVIPVAKIVLLVVGHLGIRHKMPLIGPHAGSRCIIIVQQISKWASPDVFAYILLTYLLRKMDSPPTVSSKAQLDVGFTCFSLFCVGSTLSSLWIRVPQLDEADRSNAGSSPALQDGRRCWACVDGVKSRMSELAQRLAKTQYGLKAFWVASMVVFMGLLLLGLLLPCMELRLDMETLYSVYPCLDPFRSIIDGLHIDDLLQSDVSIWECMVTLWDWGFDGDLSSIVAFIMLSVFACLFSVLDMLSLGLLVYRFHRRGDADKESRSESRSSLQADLQPTHVLSKMAMLDVCAVGIIVITLALQALKSQSLIVSLREGWAPLVLAEVCHYSARHFIIASTASPPSGDVPKADKCEEPSTVVPVPDNERSGCAATAVE